MKGNIENFVRDPKTIKRNRIVSYASQAVHRLSWLCPSQSVRPCVLLQLSHC